MKQVSTWGEWAFFVGIILAVVLGLSPSFVESGNTSLILAILGLLVGFLNVTRKEGNAFLIASIALLVIGNAGLANLPFVGYSLDGILLNISNFVAPAALIVALKTVFDLARQQ